MSSERTNPMFALVASLTFFSCGPQVPLTVSEDGFGPVKFGMTVDEAEELLNVRLEQDDYNDDEECRYYTPVSGYRGLSFMTSLRSVPFFCCPQGSGHEKEADRDGKTDHLV